MLEQHNLTIIVYLSGLFIDIAPVIRAPPTVAATGVAVPTTAATAY